MASFFTKFTRPGGFAHEWRNSLQKNGGNFFKSVGTFEKAGDVYYQGKDTIGSGDAITDAGLAGINSDIAGDQANIAAGGLTSALRNQFNVARASVLDRSAAQRTGVRANLAQRQLEAGGNLSDAALAELQLGADTTIGGNEFSATNDVNFQEAGAAQSATQAALARISDARRAVLGAGEGRANRGATLQLSALDTMLQRRKAVGSTLASFSRAGGAGGFT